MSSRQHRHPGWGEVVGETKAGGEVLTPARPAPSIDPLSAPGSGCSLSWLVGTLCSADGEERAKVRIRTPVCASLQPVSVCRHGVPDPTCHLRPGGCQSRSASSCSRRQGDEGAWCGAVPRLLVCSGSCQLA